MNILLWDWRCNEHDLCFIGFPLSRLCQSSPKKASIFFWNPQQCRRPIESFCLANVMSNWKFLPSQCDVQSQEVPTIDVNRFRIWRAATDGEFFSVEPLCIRSYFFTRDASLYQVTLSPLSTYFIRILFVSFLVRRGELHNDHSVWLSWVWDDLSGWWCLRPVSGWLAALMIIYVLIIIIDIIIIIIIIIKIKMSSLTGYLVSTPRVGRAMLRLPTALNHRWSSS